MSSPKRPANGCLDCFYIWRPRGHDVALKCPACGSTEVRTREMLRAR